MKKLFSIILVILVIFTFSACGESEKEKQARITAMKKAVESEFWSCSFNCPDGDSNCYYSCAAQRTADLNKIKSGRY